MLERLPGGQAVPSLFEETHGTTTVERAACPDKDGVAFRGEYLRQRTCVNLCADGFSSSCDAATAKSYCYREIPFSINQRDIEQGKIMKFAGFAAGNFNYRIESVGVNVVGTGLKKCDSDTDPLACFGNASVQYTLTHNGPFVVRNHAGDDFIAKLFPGTIEHARALAAERYLTNPMGSADISLLTDYMRSEFQGRPLTGNYAVRIWEDPTVDLEHMEDIQIVLRYRYWTRFQ